jgi:hypothetical protein
MRKFLSLLLIVLFCTVPLVQANSTSNFEIYATSNKGNQMCVSESVIIEGKITNFGLPFSGPTIHLVWINPDGTNEEVTTSCDAQGHFQFTFTPTVTGTAKYLCFFYDGAYTPYYTMNVLGITTSPPPSNEPTPTTSETLSDIPTATSPALLTPDPNIFNVQSNSTVSEFYFDSVNQELSFNVTGPAGTTGCTNVTIAKSFLANVDNLKVYLDGNPIDYNIISNDSFWLLSFIYHHSAHQITISLPTDEAPFNFTLAGVILTIILVIALLAILGAIVYRKKHLKKP